MFSSADLKVDEDNSLLSMTQSQDGLPPPDPLRLDWPKVICPGLIENPDESHG